MDVRANSASLCLAVLLVSLVSIATCQPGHSPGRIGTVPPTSYAGLGITMDQICAFCCQANWWHAVQIYCFQGSCGSGYGGYQPLTPAMRNQIYWIVNRELAMRRNLGMFPFYRGWW